MWIRFRRKFAYILVYPFASFFSLPVWVGCWQCSSIPTSILFFFFVQFSQIYFIYLSLCIYIVYRRDCYCQTGTYTRLICLLLQRLPRGVSAQGQYKSSYCYRCFSGLSYGFHLGNKVGGQKTNSCARAIYSYCGWLCLWDPFHQMVSIQNGFSVAGHFRMQRKKNTHYYFTDKFIPW